MKISRFILFSFLGCYIGGSSLAQQVQWPFENPNVQASVTGSLGEFRGSAAEPRFHRGNDFTNTDFSVYSIDSGAVNFFISNHPNPRTRARRTWMSVGDVFYYHIMPDSSFIREGVDRVTNVEIGTYLGEMMVTTGWPTHLHLQETNTNYLNNTISPFVDRQGLEFVDTYLRRNEGIELYRNGITSMTNNYLNLRHNLSNQLANVEYWTVYNKIDIAAHIRDQRTNPQGRGGGGEISAFRLKWEIFNSDSSRLASDSIIYNRPTEISNNQAEYVFHPSSSTERDAYRSINIITSDPYETDVNRMDQFWNSRLRTGSVENFEVRIQERDASLDAFINSQATTEDGLYRLKVSGCDTDQGGINNCIERGMNLMIDNFKPYVSGLEIGVSDDGSDYGNIYTSQWTPNIEFNGTTLVDRWIEFSSSGDPTIAPTDYVEFRVRFSEPMEWSTIENQPTIQLAGVTAQPTLVGVIDSEEFVYVMASGNFDALGADNGTRTLTINGYDLAGNQITGFDQRDTLTDDELPYRIGDTQWSGTLQSRVDTRHILNVGGTTCAPPGGRTAAGICPLVADFVHQPDFNNPKAINFTDKSTPADEITSWHWDFGDGIQSTTRNPSHSYSFNGDYPVTLTVRRGTEEDFWTAIITVTSEPLLANFSMTSTTGPAPLTVSLNSSGSQGNIQTWQWNILPATHHEFVIGNASSANPTVRFTNSGDFEISLTVGNGITTHTSSVQQVSVTPGTSGETQVDFYWEEQPYQGSQVQFFDDSFIQCIGGSPTYTWNIYEFGLQPRLNVAGNVPDPYLTFNVFGNAEVELVVDDGCGRSVKKRKPVVVENASEVNKDVFAYFGVIDGSQTKEVGDTVKLIDDSYTKSGTQRLYARDGVGEITGWDYLWDLPEGQDFAGPRTQYDKIFSSPFNNPYDDLPTHVYEEPGRYRVRSYVYKDRNVISYNHFETVILVKRSEGFCSWDLRLGTHESYQGNQVFGDGEDVKIVAGKITFVENRDVTAESGSTVNFISGESYIHPSNAARADEGFTKARVHFKRGSKVHIKSADCEELRVTFDDN